MINRTARERLLFEARDVAEDVEILEGIRGHTATLERSENGPARIIRVSHDGAVVCWTFSLKPGEAPPQFYPPDVPALPDLGCEMTWDDESGLVVKWSEELDEKRVEKVREDLSSFRGRIEKMTGEPIKPGAGLPKKEATEALAAMGFPGQEGVVAERVRDIIAFHEAAGWSKVLGGSSGPLEKVRFKRNDVERSLVATTFVASVIVLGEDGPGSEESHPAGPSQARAGLRLTWKDR